ncbi:hypothetical protein GMLC_16160 [Geomonas limicola]|uniref:Uncharacterized protein n=1 Tax=Geomonas limicola TaxID=2740186 RepID=A0A6V8N8E4_9BACT|nr:hypothetical protein [Geomonas limicola]GFO68037.1 hypothetical protein GMLC_16160 [Geomonas limicola]
MADYISALHNGLYAAEAAEIANKEIDSIFEDCNQQLSKASHGKIFIERRKFVETDNNTPLDFLIPANPFKIPQKTLTYWAISAQNPLVPDCKPKQLCKWSQHPAGYPAVISYGKVEHSCADKESLEAALVTLLQNVDVGKIFLTLMAMELPPEEGD